MARRSLSSNFRSDARLQQYFLDKVVPTGKALGSGSYGTVFEVEYNQLHCAAKQMHEVFLDSNNEGVQKLIQRYQQECQLIANIRHPNIIQFIGLCFLEDSELPLLVMEKLEMSVEDLLDCSTHLPLPIKVSILKDICSGLMHLHSMTPPIIHRDLTARNVLLTSSLTAKITDLGNARMIPSSPAHIAHTLSRVPGTMAYMPPEALNEDHKYGPSLDVFSFGHLALYVLTQTFPTLLSATQIDPNDPDRIIGRSEIERRRDCINAMEQQLKTTHPTLIILIDCCLANNPTKRPTTVNLLSTLKSVNQVMALSFGSNAERMFSVANLFHAKEMKIKTKLIEELKDSKDNLENKVEELLVTYTGLNTEKKSLEDTLLQMTEESNAEINQLKLLNQQLEARLEQERLVINKLETKLKLVEDSKFQLEVTELSVEGFKLQQKFPNAFHQDLPQFHWLRGPDMPLGMSGCIQSVLIGNTLYIGAGMTDNIEDQFTVMAYDTQFFLWSTLPEYTTRWFGMTAIKNALVLIGGHTKDANVTNVISSWNFDQHQWSSSAIRPMPTPRMCPSTHFFTHWLVIAGGFNYDGDLSVVEILDVDSNQWCTGPATPIPLHSMKSTAIGGTWYLMGGVHAESVDRSVYCVSLEALVSKPPLKSKVWKELTTLNCTCSCPLNINGSLLSIGGECIDNEKPVSYIQRYVAETNTWIQAGQLPREVFGVVTIVVLDQLYVLGGHDGKDNLKLVFTSPLI